MHKLALSFFAVLSITIPAFAQQSSRPPLITESLFAALNDKSMYDKRNYYGYSDNNNRDQANLWDKLLKGMGINTLPPKDSWGGYECQYGNAIAVLQQIRDDTGEESPYQKIWAQNQDKVFSACDSRTLENTPPLEPTDKTLPKRAATDFIYQQASWYFYSGKYDDALALYEKVANDKSAPMRPLATYMTLRTLTKLDQSIESYNKIDSILADKSLQSVHAIVANYRFILGWAGAPDDDKHLQWLVSQIKITPSKAANLKQSFADYFDAMEQLDNYFPLFDKDTKAVDWWLNDGTPDSSRMRAVKDLAPKNEFVDWMQAKWAYNLFNVDWLWALHQQQSPYWVQNKHIVAHAWQRWKNDDGLEWLQIAIQRVHPRDELAADILQAAAPYIERDWKNETAEYREWLSSIWEHSIRIDLGREEYGKALELIKQHPDYRELVKQRYATISPSHANILNSAMRWLVYTGKVQEARDLLSVMVKIYPDKFQHWSTLLATDWNDVIVTNQRKSPYQWEVENSPELWKEMVNALSTNELYKLANNPFALDRERPLIANAALTRAFMLGFDDDQIDAYATLAAKLSASVREKILASVAGHERYKFISFLLSTPRFRPNPYLQYVAVENGDNKLNDNPTVIDNYNHNDNNWWCAVNQQEIKDNIFKVARISLRNGFMNEKPEKAAIEAEELPYLEIQKKLLSEHPYNNLVDTKEMDELAKLGSGPKYLSNAAIQHANYARFKFWRGSEERNQMAADLYNAVRTTHYGCNLNGSHAEYSHNAYKILHKQYPDSTWTKATPYWFK